jgi:apolipoprotein D and lipocalin family protein
MPRLTLAVLPVLAARAAAPPPAAAFRAAVPIYSNATFDPGRLAGDWHQSAAFARPGAATCPAGRVQVGAGLAMAATLCLDGAVIRLRGQVRPSGPGRLRIDGAPPPLDGEWWMLWVDADYRTLAVGTPAGDWGMVLNRGGPVPPDRLAAARELFDFNGYDLSGLVGLP